MRNPFVPGRPASAIERVANFLNSDAGMAVCGLLAVMATFAAIGVQ